MGVGVGVGVEVVLLGGGGKVAERLLLPCVLKTTTPFSTGSRARTRTRAGREGGRSVLATGWGLREGR